MTDLTKQLEEALSRRVVEFGNVNNDAHIEGIISHADRLAPLHAALLKCVEALEFYGNKNNWNRDVNGWRHDMIQTDLDDESLTDWNGRFSGKRAREAIADLRKALEECK